MTLNQLARKLFKAGVAVRDLNAWASGDPKKIVRRYANKFIGRALNTVTRKFFFRGGNK